MKDIRLDDDLDLVFKDGDFAISESSIQHQKLLILSDKGEFKESPKRGVGAKKFLEDHKPDHLARAIRQEFSYDGMTVEKIEIGDNLKINIEANYESN